MPELVLTTYDWVPAPPRGYVRDLRIRWALEEARLPHRVATVSFEDRGPEHLLHQPFAQIPWLTDGALSVFESGAILLHLGSYSSALLPAELVARATAVQWLFAALNSVEIASLPWSQLQFIGETSGETWKRFDTFLESRLDRLEPVLERREWLAGPFSVADIAMADVLRLVYRFDRLDRHRACRRYVERATARGAFEKAHADQLAHFAAADRARFNRDPASGAGVADR